MRRQVNEGVIREITIWAGPRSSKGYFFFPVSQNDNVAIFTMGLPDGIAPPT
jgi:hypothetical protein